MFKDFSYVTIGKIISSAVLAIFYLIFAKILEPNEYGEMGFLIAIAGTTSVIAILGLPQTLVVYIAKGNKQISNQLNLLAVITTSIAAIILLFINEFSALLCLGLSFFILTQHNLLGAKKYQSFMRNAILRSGLTLLIPFPLYFALGIPGIIVGMAIANMIASVWLAKSITIKIRSFQLIKKNYKVLINNFGVDASSTLILFVDKLLVGAVFGFASLGLYNFVMQILLGTEVLPRALYLFLLSEESRGKKHEKINKLVVLVSVLIVILVIFFSPILIQTLFPNYSEAIYALQILIISLIPLSVSYIITAKMQALESSKVGFSAVVRIGSLLVLLSVLGSTYGLIGFSYSVLISTILNTIFLFFLYINYTKNIENKKSQ